jgi:hypothetical protein
MCHNPEDGSHELCSTIQAKRILLSASGESTQILDRPAVIHILDHNRNCPQVDSRLHSVEVSSYHRN